MERSAMLAIIKAGLSGDREKTVALLQDQGVELLEDVEVYFSTGDSWRDAAGNTFSAEEMCAHNQQVRNMGGEVVVVDFNMAT